VSAFAELDKTYYQGRKLHILPAQPKPPKPVEVFPLLTTEDQPTTNIESGTSISPGEAAPGVKEAKVKQSKFKEEKEKELKQNFDDEVNWNYLFMN
jgi:hypothetical protein